MYLPKSKYKKEAAKAEQFADKLTGAPYVGPVIKDFLGRIFKGSSPSNAKEELVSTNVDGENTDDLIGFNRFYPKPDPAAYSKGLLDRFFLKDSRTGKIIELSKEDYLKSKKKSKLYTKSIKIVWYITGNPEDEIINGYLYPGTKAKNQDVINQAEKILPGIGAQILKDPSQFVVK